ncbi:putative bifunctional diguanylate cyclase/phosphodiesterase [Acidithiobacillus sp. IBUN Pt1247-S3]|uniref:putative bifunctional diguanylate cyclase/phosphodiesterase n=1 Tax=Acidithiobacillus sp. IBUN Pt1247-S3 TaxID=3166642 RepID=UPI0034E43B08
MAPESSHRLLTVTEPQMLENGCQTDPLRRRSLLLYAAWAVFFLALFAFTSAVAWNWQEQIHERAVHRQDLAAEESLHRMSDLLGIMLQIHARNLLPFVVAGKQYWPAQLPRYERVHPYTEHLACTRFQETLPFPLTGCLSGHGMPGMSCQIGTPKTLADGDLHIPMQVQDSTTGRSCSATLRFSGLSTRQSEQFFLYAGHTALASWQNGAWGAAVAEPKHWLQRSHPVQGTPLEMRVFWQNTLNATARQTLLRMRSGTAILLVLELIFALASLLWLYRYDMDLRFRWAQEQMRALMLRNVSKTRLLRSLVELSVHVTQAHGAYIAEPDATRRFLRITAICGIREEIHNALRQLPLNLDEGVSPWGQLFPTLAFHRKERTDRYRPHVSGAWSKVCAEYPALRGLREVIVWPILYSVNHDPAGVFSLEIRRWQRWLFGQQLIAHWDLILNDLRRHLQSQHEQAEKERLQHFDTLTGLPTRRHFLTLAEEVLQSAQPCWLGILDLDHFNELNTIYGDQDTDHCLAEIATQIQSALPSEAIIGRVGGDEFALLLCQEKNTPALASPKIARAIGSAGKKVLCTNLSGSLGWAHFPNDDNSIGKLFHHANEALAQAKRNGRDDWQLYAGPVRERAQRRLHVNHHFANALQDGEIHFFLQGKGDLQTRRITGVELLARWITPDGRRIGPGRFMPYVEENQHLIRLLGRHALAEAARLRAKTASLGLENWSLSVNIGARHFLAPEFIDDLKEICPDGRGLILELTETAQVLGSRPARPIMESCHELGYQLSMDDFGTGYSSLLSIARLPFDEIKLDQGFVRQFRSDIASFSIAGAARLLSHLSHIRLIAEGIASPAELRLWQQLGGRYVQGYLLAPALPENAFFTWHGTLMPQLLHPEPVVPLQDLNWLWELMQSHQPSKRRRNR